MAKKLLLIVNPKSGKIKNPNFIPKIQQILTSMKWEVTTILTEYSKHATEIASKAAEYDRIVCAGGDGTLNEVINGIMNLENKPSLGYIPSGSTNDFASGLGLSNHYKKSAHLAGSDELSPIDIGAYTDDSGEKRYFSYVASFGLFTEVSYNTNQKIKNIFGHMAYVFEGIKSVADFKKFRPFHMKIETEGSIIEQDYIFGAITNSTSLGGLVKLDKNNVFVNDGVFELILIRNPKTFLDLTDTVTQLVNHKYTPDKIIFSHTDKIKLTSDIPLAWTLDGELAGSTSTVSVDVVHSAIDFVRHEEVRPIPFFLKKNP